MARLPAHPVRLIPDKLSKTMRAHPICTKVACITLGIVAAGTVILVAGYALRGWIRTTVVPSYYQRVYAGRLDQTFRGEDARLGHTLQLLGMQHIQTRGAGCKLGEAQDFEVEVYCSTMAEGSLNLGSKAEFDVFSQRIHRLHETLLAHGWRGGKQAESTALLIYPVPPVGWYIYGKTTDGADCFLEIGDNSGNYPNGDNVFAWIDCTRNVYFL